MRAPLLALVAAVAAHGLLPGAATPAHAKLPASLVVDGVPEIPPAVAARMRQYLNARGAALLDWHPSGEGMLIATRFGDTTQVHHVARPGGARTQLTFFDEPVTEASWLRRRPQAGFVFRMDQGGGEFYQYYAYDLGRGAHRLLTDGKSRNEGWLPSYAGDRAAFLSTKRNGRDYDLYLASDDGASVRLLRELAGQWHVLDWSPDDAALVVRHYVSIVDSTLHVIDTKSGALTDVRPTPGKRVAYGDAVFARPAGGGRALLYTSDEDGELRRLYFHDLTTGERRVVSPPLAWDVDQIAVSEDGAHLAFTVNEGGASALYLAPARDPQAIAGAARRVDLPRGVVSRLRFDRQSRRLGFTISATDTSSDVFSIDMNSRALERWTTSEVGGLDRARFVAPERVEWKSFDGRMISGWLYRPRGDGGGKSDERRAPVIVSIHGGPESQSTAAFNPVVQYWVNELGAAVILPNVRGSAGYGKSFLALDDGPKREDAVKDIGALLDWIGGRPDLDPKRVAVYGGSYGGYMVLASLVHHGARLRCGVDMVGISNFVTFLERTEAYRRDLRRVEYGDERDPKMRELLQAISPLSRADRITRPLFVAQGQNDPRVPVGEAEQIVRTVRARPGATVWYMLARDEGHGFQKKPNRDAFLQAVSLFFEEHLLK
jgi:dipeptidyl aminopeptidase/acylaminoacyl peptidase